ncbi:MAG: nuclear transport factor 2 family protein [Candidatus Binataceae bacterium]
MANQKLQVLEDRAAIAEVMQRYGMSIDTRDWAALRSCFADEMEIDLSATPFGSGRPLIPMSGDAWLESIKRIVSQFAVTQHMISPYHIDVDGDRAVCLAYLQACHFPPECKDEKSVWGLGGYYTNTMLRTSEGWKILIWKLTDTWQENAPNPESVAPEGA